MLTATIALASDQAPVKIDFKVVNNSSNTIEILNPDMGRPSADMNWPYSNETYQTAVLLSFSFLSLGVQDSDGQQVQMNAISSWATPALQPKLQLAPRDSFVVTIPLGDFYKLDSGKTYRVSVEYGDQQQKVSVVEQITIP